MFDNLIISVFVVIGIGFLLLACWKYLVLGALAYGAFSFFVVPINLAQYIETPQAQTVKYQQTFQPQQPVANENIKKTSSAWFLKNWFSAKTLDAVVNETTGEKIENKPVDLFDRPDNRNVVETDEMKEYVKNCFELTRNMAMCRENWHNVANEGGELVLDPVDRPVKIVSKTQNPKPEVTKPQVTQKLLEVDNEEYKERRAEVLKNPGAVVIHATYY